MFVLVFKTLILQIYMGLNITFTTVLLNNSIELSKSICLFHFFAILLGYFRCANVREYFCTVIKT